MNLHLHTESGQLTQLAASVHILDQITFLFPDKIVFMLYVHYLGHTSAKVNTPGVWQ